jgi:para-aminobenzoate synthetase component 1
VRATRPDIVQRQLPAPVSPLHALSVLHNRDRPVLARFHDHTIVAADPADVVIGERVWDALRIPCAGASTGVTAAAGAWIGLLSYDLAGTIEHLPAPIVDSGGPPLAAVGRYETVAVIDSGGRCVVMSCAGEHAADALRDRLTGPAPQIAPVRATAPPPRPSLTAARYLASVERIRELIRAGDCYQVNLTKRLTSPWTGSALSFAKQIWHTTGDASHCAYIGLPEGTVVSASPERLVVVRDGVATAEPIKGTAPRGHWSDLAASVKDRAEHVMIVDLLRNDLGRVARAGGVSVPRLFAHLPTPYVEHMVSEIRAELRSDVTATDVLRAVFPSGSVTGTPKVRSMEVIRELEPVSRGPAFGSVVVVGTDGAIESSVTIRTAWIAGDEARYWCGGAVVWDSNADAELAEAGAKAVPFMRTIGGQ